MKAKESNKGKGWVVYILHCSDETPCTGITKNIEKRLRYLTGNKNILQKAWVW